MPDSATPLFWRDDRLPFIEARFVADGRTVCYSPHSHDTFSIGAITGGRSTYLNGKAREQVGAGAVVVMNPEEVHACNPIDDASWSYRMLYVDLPWLTALQHSLGFSANQDFSAFSTMLTTDAALYAGLERLGALLMDSATEPLQKHAAAVAYFTQLQQGLNPSRALPQDCNAKLQRAAEFIRENCTRSLTLDEICTAADLSASYLIRAFNKRYGMTPHAYLVNRRLQYGQAQLRRGRPIVDVALEAGFADQAHFQRAFKRFFAATPGQYQS